MVGISYVGADGSRHEFGAESPKDALARLSRIKGYANAKADALTQTLGAGLKAKRKQRAAAFAAGGGATNSPYDRVDGLRGGEGVTRVSVVTGVSLGKDGEIFAETLDLLVPKSVGISRTGRVSVGKVSVGAAKEGKRDEGPVLTVVTGSAYDPETHKFVNTTATVEVAAVHGTGEEEVFETVMEAY